MENKPLVVFTTNHPWVQRVAREVAPPHFEVRFIDHDDPAQVAAWLPQADFLVCLRLPPADARLLQRCRLVIHNGVGFDGIDVRTLDAMGIPVAITPALTAEGVGEHTLLLILALNKQLIPAQASVRRGEFNLFAWREKAHTLAGKTLGIVGLGRIGRRVAHLAHAFGCRILYNDLVPAPPELVRRLSLNRVSFAQVVAEADVLTVHVPLTDLTRGMFGAPEFARMPAGSLFINTSRGGTYDLDALYDALASGHLRGAGLDVFAPEPPPAAHPLLQLPQVICTPHIASGTVERQYAINRDQFANCQRVLDGLPPLHQVDPDEGVGPGGIDAGN